ncbi:MAG TPA: hypothetical protein VGN86_09020 [Pyrinomonadaceae bacterium]|nr:hypothetical protein [Pyrinomonadaceae bacterium]
MKSMLAGKSRLAGWFGSAVVVTVLAALGSGCSTGLNEPLNLNGNPKPSSTANLKPAGPAPQFYIDFVNGKALPPSGPVSIGGDSKEVVISGWAIDHKNKKPAGGVVLVVDGKDEFTAEYGSARPDVAAFLKESNYNPVGFSISIPRSALAKGNHTISFKVISADHQEYFEPDRKVELTMP